MYSFKDDYSELGHEKVLADLIKISREQLAGYGADRLSLHAKEVITKCFGLQNADIHFLAGGTQTNLVFIDAALNKLDTVIAPDSGHICNLEAGAIEHNGNKIITASNNDGKICVQDIEKICAPNPLHEHMACPKLVFISQPTEKGTVYSKHELETIYQICKKHRLYLYIDGARLGAALTAKDADLKPDDLAKLCDAFYIGGTKNGSPIGEALCILNDELKRNFRKHMKQHGALLAKGSLIASCFNTLFKDDLYFELSRHANQMAQKLRDAVTAGGYELGTNSTTNLLFPILPNEKIAHLQKHFDFYTWGKIDDNSSVMRIICSWATNEQQIDKFIAILGCNVKSDCTFSA